ESGPLARPGDLLPARAGAALGVHRGPVARRTPGGRTGRGDRAGAPPERARPGAPGRTPAPARGTHDGHGLAADDPRVTVPRIAAVRALPSALDERERAAPRRDVDQLDLDRGAADRARRQVVALPAERERVRVDPPHD